MGIVVAATHLELGHRVAIKFLRDEMAANPTIVDRFMREARSVVHLRTEHVCRVFDVGRLDNNAPYMVMEMLDGSDLAHAIAKQPLPLTTAVEYVMQACVALAEAHAAGVIHRDLKPANLFVTRRLDGGPLVKVLDFGIAKALAEIDAHLTHNSAMGSPGYMSPEQLLSARDVDHRTDIWALGVTLYQLLSARLPFPSANMTEIGVRIATDPPDPLDVDPALCAVVFRCLEKAPDARYPDVASLVAALIPFGGPSARTIAAQVGQLSNRSIAVTPLPQVVPATAPTAAGTVGSVGSISQTPAARPSRRGRWVVLSAVLLVGGGIAAIAITSQPQHREPVAIVHDVVPATKGDVVVTPDARVELVTAAAADASSSDRDPWASPVEVHVDVPVERHVDAGVPPPDARPQHPTSPERITDQMKKMSGIVKQQCQVLTSPAMIDRMPPIQIIMCWCQLGDRAHAQATYARLATDDARQQARAQCASAGVKLE